MSNGKAAPEQEQAIASDPDRVEPRWPAMIALFAVGALRLTLPQPLAAGPGWLLILVVAVLIIPTAWTHRRGLHDLNKILGYVLTSIVTADMIWSLCLLVSALPAHRIPRTSCCDHPPPYGFPTFLSSRRGIGGLTRADHTPVICAASIPTELFSFRR